ncbi:MAG: hypothetical protein RI934_1220, partial [Bacteroidota bacterium]
REVKPHSANGTAVKCGRVGRRQILFKPRSAMFWAFFLNLIDRHQLKKNHSKLKTISANSSLNQYLCQY